MSELQDRLPALCCESGTPRTYSRKAGLRRHISVGRSIREIVEFEARFGRAWKGSGPFHRQLSDMKCVTCKGVTRHALIRDGSDTECIDAENQVPEVAVDEDDQQLLRDEIDRLERFGVRVRYQRARGYPFRGSYFYTLFQYRDQRFLISLNPDVPARLFLLGLRDIWKQISDPEECEKIDWDPCDDPSRPDIARTISCDISDSGFKTYSESWINDVEPTVQIWAQFGLVE